MAKKENIFIKGYRVIVPESTRRKMNEKFNHIRMERKNRELMERKSYGNKNRDKTFYVIRTDSTQRWGVFTTYNFVLNNIKYACEHNWIPVVDYKNYYLCGLQDEDKRGKENAWNYYFEDLVPEYSLDEVYESQNVILGPLRGQPCGSIDWSENLDFYSGKYKKYFQLANQYIRFNKQLLEKVQKIYQQVFPKQEKVLGVTIRAGAYWGYVTQDSGWKNHRKGLSVQECIQHIIDCMEELKVQSFFLSCDDQYYIDTIKEKFGDKCYYYQRTRSAFFQNDGTPNTAERTRVPIMQCDVVERNQDYIIEVILLSKCNYLLGIKGGAAVATHFIKGEPYEKNIML